MESIKKSLPEIVKQIERKLEELRGELDAMGSPPPSSSREKSNFLMNLISDFATDYRNTLSGKYVANSQSQSETIGRGALIKGKFKNLFIDFTSSKFKCSQEYDDQHIKNSLMSHQGDQIAGFPSMECFRSLLIPQLYKLKEPIYTCLDEIYQELVELSSELNNKVFYRFPDLLGINS